MNQPTHKKNNRQPIFLSLMAFLFLSACTSFAGSEPPATATPPPLLDQTDPTAAATLNTLLTTDQPTRDLISLTERYKKIEVPTFVTHPPSETAILWFNDKDSDTHHQTEATLRYQSDLLNIWVEDSAWVTDRTINQAAAQIETAIIPINRELFGSEWQPGIDGEPQINIFNVSDMGESVLGYFSSADEFPPAVNPFSNAREMMYLNLNKLTIGEDEYLSVIAHEYEHMIHWHQDRNETIWLNEGMAEVAAAVNGYGDSDHMPSFLRDPDTPLTYFDYEGGDYGGAYLFSRYFYDRFGAEATRQLVQHPDNGIPSVEAVLATAAPELTFNQLFADWVALNYIASNDLQTVLPSYEGVIFPQGVYGQNLVAGDQAITTVNPYGTDYFRVGGESPVTFVFTGTQQVPLLDTAPYSGRYLWSTLPADSQDSSLTRSFDLTAVPTATLTFATWYDIELGWDYTYLAISSDDGQTWDTLQTVTSSEANPNGNNLGYGYTGTSGSLAQPQWIEQTADLTPYSGQHIRLRFEYVTDTAIHQQGFALDDIAIPELNFFDDAETDTAGWDAVGFARHTNQLPQTFLVQQLLIDENNDVSIEALLIDENNHGRWTIPLTPTSDRAIIAVSSLTPITFQPATYSYKVEMNHE